jgi:hypothetical protein
LYFGRRLIHRDVIVGPHSSEIAANDTVIHCQHHLVAIAVGLINHRSQLVSGKTFIFAVFEQSNAMVAIFPFPSEQLNFYDLERSFSFGHFSCSISVTHRRNERVPPQPVQPLGEVWQKGEGVSLALSASTQAS